MVAEVTHRMSRYQEERSSYKCCVIYLVGTCILRSRLQFHSETYIKAPYGMKLLGALNLSRNVYFCIWTRDYNFYFELPKSSSKAMVIFFEYLLCSLVSVLH